MAQNYLKPLIEQFEANRNEEFAVNMKKYMKDQYPFFGIKTPARRGMITHFLKEYGLPQWEAMEDITRQLWEMDEREYQHTAVDLLNRMKKKLDPDDIPQMEYMISTKSWWDTVDAIAGWLVGAIMKSHPVQIRPVTTKWMDSGNIWLQRSCLLFQLQYKKDTDLDLLFELIEKLADDKTFWIRKAIGWVLREYSKTDPKMVIDFVNSHPQLSGLSKREALKVINRAKGQR